MKKIELLHGVKPVGLAAYFQKQKILAIGDVHMGYEEALNKQGIFIPRTQFKEAMTAAKKIFSEISPKTVVLMGDLKHEFGTISNQEWDDTSKFLDFLLAKAQVILLKGNHDTILGPIANKKDLQILEYYKIDDLFFCHGDKIFKNNAFKEAKTVVIGHEHPALGIRDGARVEKYKCFLVGKYLRKNLLVLPSFNFVTEGTDVLQERLLSPFIKDIDAFSGYVVSDKVYNFGEMGKLRKTMTKNN